MNEAAKKLLTQLIEAEDSTTRRDLVQASRGTLLDQHGEAACTPKQAPEVVLFLGRALSILLQTALQPQDWVQPSHLQHLDTCTLLVSYISPHLHKAFKTPWIGVMVGYLQASGLLAALPDAMDRACRVLTAPDSPAGTDLSFTQYLASLMTLWNDLFRKTPSDDCLELREDHRLGHLLLPGAQLAAAALRIYAGPNGARIMADNKAASGHVAPVLASVKHTVGHRQQSPARIQQLGQQALQAAGRVACAGVIANALRIADTLTIYAYNATVQQASSDSKSLFGAESLTYKLLADAAVSKLVAAMLFVQAKRLHTQQEGKAGVAAPRTRTSGRIKQAAPTGTASSSAPAVQVPPHHNLVAGALDLDLLLADEELYLQVTGYGSPDTLPRIDLTRHDIDSIMIDPLMGLSTIVLHAIDNSGQDFQHRLFRCTVLAEAKIRITPHLNDGLSQAVMLTAIELCMLQPKQHGEHALQLVTFVITGLYNSFLHYAGVDAVAQYVPHFSPAAAHWVDGPNPLDDPDLHDLMAPVFRDLVTCLVPLLLPECHDIPLPTSGAADPSGSQLSALLPQQILMAAAAAGQSVLAELLQEHPLYTTRGLEAALRADWTEQAVAPVLRSSLLKAIPAVLSSLGQPVGATSSSPAAAASTSKLAAALLAPNSKQLLLQLHALLVSVAKYAGGLNGRALAAAAVPDGDSSKSAVNKERLRQNMVAQIAEQSLPPLLHQMLMSTVDSKVEATAKLLAVPGSMSSTVGRFRGTLELFSGVAAAAAALGRAVSLAAAGSTLTSAVATASSSACSGSSSSKNSQPLLAPFVSLIGRCLYLTGAALSAASTQAPPGLEPAEFASCSSILATLLSCLEWLVAEPGGCCQELLASTGAADAAAVSELRSSLQAQQLLLQGEASPSGAAAAPLQGLAVADRLYESGLTGQLQAVGAAMCGVSTGVCGNPGCLSLLELSEIALVTPGGSKRKGCGKCSACATTSYCSRDCQKTHWRSGHKAFCRAHQQPAAAPLADAAPAASPGDAAA